MRRLLTLATLTTALLLAMAGAAFAADVGIEDDGLSPTRIVVDVREPIVWTNNTDEPVALVGEEPGWESGEIGPGATFSIEITREGTYSYGSQDGTMRGQIVVRGEGGGNGDGNGGKAKGDDEEPNVAEQRDREAAEQDEKDAVDPNEEALPTTGVDAVVPGALSLLLMAIGVGLLLVTHPERALRR